MERIPQPIMDKRGEPHMKRFEEQRWLLDNIVRANGVDWDQPRSIYISSPCGPEGGADIAGVRNSSLPSLGFSGNGEVNSTLIPTRISEFASLNLAEPLAFETNPVSSTIGR